MIKLWKLTYGLHIFFSLLFFLLLLFPFICSSLSSSLLLFFPLLFPSCCYPGGWSMGMIFLSYHCHRHPPGWCLQKRLGRADWLAARFDIDANSHKILKRGEQRKEEKQKEKKSRGKKRRRKRRADERK